MANSTSQADPLSGVFDNFADSLEGLKGDALAAYNNLSFYSEYVMGYGNPEHVKNSKFIDRIYEVLQYDPDRNILVLGPRGSAKSSAITITYTTWQIGRNPLIRIMLAFAAAEAQGLAFGRQIDQILSNNQRYIEVFGMLKPKDPVKWTESEKIVIRNEPPGGLKDPTISVVGLTSNIPSRRADIIICDDLVTQDNAYSEAYRARVKSFVMQSLFPILVPGGRRIIVGSRWDPRDLYAEVAEMWGLELPEPEDINLTEFKELHAG